MPIRPVPPPEQSIRALVNGLRTFARTDAGEGIVPEARADDVLAAIPGRAFRYYSVQAGDLADGQLLWECARYHGWRYLLPDRGGESAAEVIDGDDHVLGVTNESDLNVEAFTVLRTLESRPEIAGADYEPKYLTIPALSIVALWLDTDPAVMGFVVCVPSWERRFERHRLYPIVEFDAALRPLALNRVLVPDPI